MTEIEVIKEERKRFLKDYFEEGDALTSDDPVKEIMRQARNISGVGIFKRVGESPKLASLLLDIDIPLRRWSKRDIGKVKSVRTRGYSLKKLASTLGRSPSSVYSLISRLKKKGEIK